MARELSIPQRTAVQEILGVEHNVGISVRVVVASGSMKMMPAGIGKPDALKFVQDQSSPGRAIEIAGADYLALMAGNPDWSPDKPADTFRNDDLWHFVDAIEMLGPATGPTGQAQSAAAAAINEARETMNQKQLLQVQIDALERETINITANKALFEAKIEDAKAETRNAEADAILKEQAAAAESMVAQQTRMIEVRTAKVADLRAQLDALNAPK